MTVAGNVAFGLKVAKKAAAEIRDRVAEMLDVVKLGPLADRYPYQISGGQQQRVALARALATSPKLLLLDEPLSALDAKVRVALRDELKSLQRDLGITTVFVTHDQEEALSMSDRIVVMSEGRIEQLGTPFEIYNRPKTRFVASFIGTLNILKVRVVDAQAGCVRIDGQDARLGRQIPAPDGSDCAVALRPEAVSLQDPGNGCNRIGGTVEDVAFLGAVVRIKVGLGSDRIMLDRFNRPRSAAARAGRAGDAALLARRPRAARRRVKGLQGEPRRGRVSPQFTDPGSPCRSSASITPAPSSTPP